MGVAHVRQLVLSSWFDNLEESPLTSASTISREVRGFPTSRQHDVKGGQRISYVSTTQVTLRNFLV